MLAASFVEWREQFEHEQKGRLAMVEASDKARVRRFRALALTLQSSPSPFPLAPFFRSPHRRLEEACGP